MIEKEKITSVVNRRKFIGQAMTMAAVFSIIPRHVLGGKGFVAPRDRINLGFIGTGRQGITLQKFFSETGEEQIIAACDVYKQKLNNFVKVTNEFYTNKYGTSSSYKSCTPY